MTIFSLVLPFLYVIMYVSEQNNKHFASTIKYKPDYKESQEKETKIMADKNVIIPRGNDVILPGDNVIIVSKNLTLHDINDILK